MSRTERTTYLTNAGEERTAEIELVLLGALRAGYPMKGWPFPWTEVRVCTGVAARWCPIHGTCTCWDPETDGDSFRGHCGTDADGNDCPLHAATSTHADAELRRILESSQEVTT